MWEQFKDRNYKYNLKLNFIAIPLVWPTNSLTGVIMFRISQSWKQENVLT